MKWRTEKLQALGFRRVAQAGNGGQAWIRIRIKKMVSSDASDAPSEWAVGQLVLIWPRFATQLQVAVDMTVCRLEALGAIAESPSFQRSAEAIRRDPEVSGGGGMFKALRKFGKPFRDKVNKVAAEIARNKIANQLRKAYIKAIEGPIADMGIEAGARALSAFGVPAAATKLAINQRRFASIDRMQHGGWAGLAERGSGPAGLRGALREEARRQVHGGREALKRALPAGISQLADAANRKVAESTVSGDWRWCRG